MHTLVNMPHILKSGAILEAKVLTDCEVKELLSKVQLEQSKIQRMKKIDYEKLQNTFITI